MVNFQLELNPNIQNAAVNSYLNGGINYDLEGNCSASIFDNTITEKNIEILNEHLKSVTDNNGCFLGLWNGVKNIMGLGVTDEKCNEVIEAYKKGEIDFDEADKKIKEYSTKQKSSLNLFSNIAASVAALGAAALAAFTGFAATPFALVALGSGTGAVTKAGFKLADRASNDVDGDALNAKEIIKDGLSGAFTGGIATVTMGTAGTAKTMSSAVVGCAKTGIKTGALSSGANYAIDCAFDDNEFNAKEFALTTLEGAAVGGVVGAIMGGANFTMHDKGILNHGCNFKTFTANAGKTSTGDVVANAACTAEYKIVNDRLRSIAT